MYIFSSLINLLTASHRFLAAGLFGFPTWYEYLPIDTETGEKTLTGLMDVWLIVAAGLEMIVRLAGILAVFYFIYSGFVLMTSQGNPDRVSAGRKGMLFATVGLIISVLSAVLVSFIASAFTATEDTGALNIPGVRADDSTVENVLKYIFTILGAIAVLMVVIGGIRYIISAGNPQQAATAKNTIIYALIGIIISVSAFAIVNFIFNVIDSNPGALLEGAIAIVDSNMLL